MANITVMSAVRSWLSRALHSLAVWVAGRETVCAYSEERVEALKDERDRAERRSDHWEAEYLRVLRLYSESRGPRMVVF